jgi:hypothetical protein
MSDTTDQNKKRNRKGVCPHCEYRVSLAPDGLTIYHGDVRTRQGDCLGSRELPKAEETRGRG